MQRQTLQGRSSAPPDWLFKPHSAGKFWFITRREPECTAHFKREEDNPHYFLFHCALQNSPREFGGEQKISISPYKGRITQLSHSKLLWLAYHSMKYRDFIGKGLLVSTNTNYQEQSSVCDRLEDWRYTAAAEKMSRLLVFWVNNLFAFWSCGEIPLKKSRSISGSRSEVISLPWRPEMENFEQQCRCWLM